MHKFLDFILLWFIALVAIAIVILVILGWTTLNKWLDPIWPRWAMIVINIFIASFLVALMIWMSKEE